MGGHTGEVRAWSVSAVNGEIDDHFFIECPSRHTAVDVIKKMESVGLVVKWLVSVPPAGLDRNSKNHIPG